MSLTLTEAAFWGSILAVVYAYLGYPAILALARLPRPCQAAIEPPPSLSVIVAAYNEETCIARKVHNIRGHDYPEERLEIIVVSDGSTDRTAEIVRTLTSDRVHLLEQPAREGKNAALNRGAREATGQILVFTDANAMLAPGALRRLVAPFVDSSVGLVSGQGLYGELGAGTPHVISNAYVRYERFIKEREASLGFLAGADGALYAMRSSAYVELRSDQVHDLKHPIQVALSGKRSGFEPRAFTVEPPSRDAVAEFRRHVRIIAQGFRVLLPDVPALLAGARFKELWMLTSHRLLRWTSSLFLGVALMTNAVLLPSGKVYWTCLTAQMLFYALAAAGALGERLDLRLRLLAIPYYFCVVSAAGAGGLVDFVKRRGHVAWAPTGGR